MNRACGRRSTDAAVIIRTADRQAEWEAELSTASGAGWQSTYLTWDDTCCPPPYNTSFALLISYNYRSLDRHIHVLGNNPADRGAGSNSYSKIDSLPSYLEDLICERNLIAHLQLIPEFLNPLH